ncbi:CotH kinase family protein [bacterium]|nr:CotH kinase family protein [bacterium]
MKNIPQTWAPILSAALIAPGTAASITWDPVADTTDPTVIITDGSLVEAINGSGAAGVVTVNGVNFSPSDTLLPTNAASVALSSQTTLDPGLDDLLNTVEFGGGTATSITVGGGALVSGQTYTIQVFFTDLRSCCSGRVMTYGDGEGNTVDITASGVPGTFGQFATGTFIADGTNQTLSLTANGFGNVHINGYQVRSAFPLPVVSQFTVTPSLITSGESTTLDWQISNADSAEIDKASINATSGSLVVSPTTTTTYTLTATNGGGSITSEVTVGVDVPVLPPVLNEFLASNDSDFADEDGNFSDWIEIYNPNPFAIDLDGYHLTSNSTNPIEWSFPTEVTLDGNSYLIIFASGTSRGLPELHTNFKISASGGYLALIAPDGSTVINEFVNYPPQRTDISYGPSGYFSSATPGETNGAASGGFVDDTSFDIDRGFYDAPFTVNIVTTTPGATVVHTTDGTEPSLSNGTASLDAASLLINSTTVLRAAAFKAGLTPTNVDTQTYLFTSDIIEQANMDPDVVDDPAYNGEIESALQSVRTLSIVTNPDNLFDDSIGILANTGGRGLSWERPVSIEFIDPSNPTASLQTNAGLRMHGNGSRGSPKNSLRLLFRADYGPKKLNYPLFGKDFVAQKFNTVVLRAQNANSWTRGRAEDRTATTFLQDSFAKDTQGAMGQPTAGSTFVHLFLNGTYWGLYNPTERPDGSFGEDHFGGDDTDYDAVSRRFSVEVQSGTKTHWDEMITFSNNLLDTQAEYEGLHDFMDVDNLIDYMLVHQFMQTRDGPDDFGHNNMRLVRRNNPAGPWQAYAWDMEYSMIDTTGTRNYSYPFPIYSSPRNNNNDITDSIASVYIRLKDNNPEFQLRYADRAFKHLFNGGALSPTSAAARFEARAEEIESAVIGESARWGDQQRSAPYTRDVEWTAERTRITTEFLPARPDHVVAQLRIHGLYPSIDPPALSQHGGEVAPGFNLSLSTAAGAIYYSTDGSDPREAWTDNPLGSAYSAPINLSQSLTVKARTLNAGEWSALTEATFVVGTPASSANLIVSELNYHPPAGQEGREFIELLNISNETIDLGGVSFSAGIEFTFAQNTTLPAGGRIMVVNELGSFTLAEQADIAGIFQNFTRFDNGGERITLVDYLEERIFDFSYLDDSSWSTFPDGGGPSLTLIDPANSPDLSDPFNWRSSSLPGGTPGGSDSTTFSGDPLADDNHNGVSNFVEYAVGPQLTPGFITSGEQTFFTLTFNQNLSADDVIATVESSSDLITWTPSTVRTSVIYNGDGTNTVSWQANANLTTPQRFLRICITSR